jgi:hypothetical protein
MDENTKQELDDIKRLLTLNFAEIEHLRQRLFDRLTILEEGSRDYPNGFADYLNELDKRITKVITGFPPAKTT